MQRWRRQEGGQDLRGGPRAPPANRLSEAERGKVLETLNSAEFRDLSPKQVVPTLADRDAYLASESTMYRILRAEGQLAHRSAWKPARSRKPLERVATGRAEVWSWDITYLKSPVCGVFFFLYLVVDIWSRKIVGWAVKEAESTEYAAELFDLVCAKEGIVKGSLCLHSDNGNPMTGSTLKATLERLGVLASFSRPGVSDDNPYSEALFRTLKYRPDYPTKPFANLLEAIEWVSAFVDWYNDVHLHSAIRFVTPNQRHEGQDHEILAKRRGVYERARQQHPERWAREIRNWQPIEVVCLNPEQSEVTPDEQRKLANLN